MPLIVSAMTWPWTSIARAPLIVIIFSVAGDRLGRVDELDRQEGDVLVLVEPPVELLRARGERRDRDAVVAALVRVRDLAGLVERHQAVREHLGVDAEVALVAVGELGWRSPRGWCRCRSGGSLRRARTPRRAWRSRGRPRSARRQAAGGESRRPRRGCRSRRPSARACARAGRRRCAGSSVRSRRRAGGRGRPRRGSSRPTCRRRGARASTSPPSPAGRRRSPSRAGSAPRVAGAKRRKSAAANEMFAPASRSARSNGPKKPER